MALQRLSDSMAFSSGATLWVIPSPKQSAWGRKIDWYLNFVAALAEEHESPTISDGMRDMLKEVGLAEPSASIQKSAPLLMRSYHRLPATQVVVVNFSGDAEKWLASTAKIWRGLGCPAMRLFLPSQLTPAAAEKLWNEEQSESVSLVADSDHLLGN